MAGLLVWGSLRAGRVIQQFFQQLSESVYKQVCARMRRAVGRLWEAMLRAGTVAAHGRLTAGSRFNAPRHRRLLWAASASAAYSHHLSSLRDRGTHADATQTFP